VRVLLVDDHDRLASLVCTGLAKAGLDADVAATAAAAEQFLAAHHYEAVVLDLGLPDRDGLQLLKDLRGRHDPIPVLVLTSRVQVADRVKGLDAGADDYLTKPFAMEELVSRLRALLRRPRSALGQVLTAGNVSFDVGARDARVGASSLKVSPRESRILEQLLRREGKVVPKSLLEQDLYGIEGELSSNSVEVLVHRVRKKLADAHASATIHTVRGVGYMILAQENPPASHA
jgi:DNA-binding response OmpR family regulator